MSLIDIHIQANEFGGHQAEYYDEMNVQLADDDVIESRCGEIYISRRKILIFACTECKENFCSYDDFFTHLCEQHLNADEEEDLKYSPTEELAHENSMEDNLTVVDTDSVPDEHLDVKPAIKANLEEASGDGYSHEMLESFETIDEYEALEESEGNRTVTFLNAFSPFPEKDKDSDIEEQVRGNESNSSVDNPPADTLFFHENQDYECKECHRSFQTPEKLLVHTKHHQKPRNYKCNICGFAFAEEFNLRAHIKRHNGEKPHACERCNKKFSTRNEVKAHMRSHTGERPYICEICGQKYATSGSLNEHKKRHTNFRPHKCKLCIKSFFDSGLLKEHMVLHTGERTHICKVCDASFTRRKALLQHVKLHSGIKQYKCDFCDKAFAQKPGLASHLKTHKNLYKTHRSQSPGEP